ncbi:MAG: hypothetical protein K0R28_307, partial [Paenibacillus sp.]|nr:hypothetical protein [Paenibacillus sp.]
MATQGEAFLFFSRSLSRGFCLMKSHSALGKDLVEAKVSFVGVAPFQTKNCGVPWSYTRRI